MTDTQQLIDAVAHAHEEVLAAQEELERLAVIRDRAVAAAVAGGAGGATVARALGVSRSRVSHMLTRHG